MNNGLIPLARLQALMGQSIDALAEILADRSLPAGERADLALRLLSLGLGAGSAPAPAPNADAGLPLQSVTIPDFLSAEQHAEVVRIALANRARFVKSTVTTNAEGYRESQVLHATEFPALYEALRHEIIAALPSVFGGLALAPFPVPHVEMQMTAHGDGAFFKVHDDAGSPDTERRALTYVYYFQAHALRGFTGGGLRIYRTYPQSPMRHDPAQFREIEPLDNSLVFFDSHLMHEVLPVSVPSGAFEDWRFTVNGWLHR
jgi:Rps23 Pro-64 3,4-dihydroxylase Tpa1-like proline 4-hydroxylase